SGEGLVVVLADGGLWLVPVDGGPPAVVVPASRGPVQAPSVAPDDSAVAYVVDQRDVAVQALDGGSTWPVRLSDGADFCFDPAWSAEGTRRGSRRPVPHHPRQCF